MMKVVHPSRSAVKRPLLILLVLALLASTMIPALADNGKVYRLAGDFNGDGITTPGWFTDGVFVLYGATDGRDTVRFRYGRPGDVPVVGDWTGDGRDTVGVVRNGRRWFLRDSNTSGDADRSFVYGGWLGRDRPVVGDWTGKGYDAPGVVRGSTWHLRTTLSAGNSDITFTYGRVGDIPVAGDWTNKGRDTAGVVRDGVWHLRDTNRGGGADWIVKYGRENDVPVTGNWDGRGGDTPGVVRGTTWMLKNTLSGGPADVTVDLADAAVNDALAEPEIVATRKPTLKPKLVAPGKPLPEPEPEPEPTVDPAPSPDGVETAGVLTRTSIGSPQPAGQLSESGGTYTLSGAGADIWKSSDSFEFAHQPFDGDGSLMVRVDSQTNTHEWAKAGLMIRNGLEPGAQHVSVFQTPANGVALQYRASPGGSTAHIAGVSTAAPTWLRLDRMGNSFKAYSSNDGVMWTLIGSVTVAMATVVIAGLAVTSQNDGTTSLAEFSEFGRVEAPAAEVGASEPDPEPSVIEQLDAAEGARYLYADADIREFRSRMSGGGPFFATGDAGHGGPYSPNDGQRSLQLAADFLANPSASYWVQADLPFSQGDAEPNRIAYARPMHAAWVYMTQPSHPRRDDIRREVKALLLHHAGHPSHNFSDSASYPISFPGYAPNPIFAHAHWMTRMIKARDMLGRGSFTDRENAELDRWLYDYANWAFNWLHQRVYSKSLPGRENRDYGTINVRADASRTSYDGGPKIGSLAMAYTNRHAAVASSASLAANYIAFSGYRPTGTSGPSYGRYSVDGLLLHSRLFVEETIRFSVYPQGVQGDFERGDRTYHSNASAQQGWLYSANVLANLIEIADYHGRRGDLSVWNYGTNQGHDGTAGAPKVGGFEQKNLHFYAWSMSRYVNDGWARRNRGEPLALPHFYHDVLPASVAASYFGDDLLLEAAWKRQGSGFPDYPGNPQSQGSWDARLGSGAKSVGLIEHGGLSRVSN